MKNTKNQKLGGFTYMNTIPQTNENKNNFMKSIVSFIKRFKVMAALKKANS